MKLSWIFVPLTNALWLTATMLGSIGASRLAKSLAINFAKL
uniref:Uncharacterized protein n=1 Tax=Arundo donax TaxID=35708 RepID=A0A0A9AGZ9_ARUDO